MKTLKSARTLAASLGVLAFGALAATPAQAFNTVDWTWTKTVTQTETIDVTIDLDIDTTGMVEAEALQIYLGDITATSTVCFVCYYDCVDVGAVVSTATAIANLISINSDVPVYLHTGQFLANADGDLSWCDPSTLVGLLGSYAIFGEYADANLNTALALSFTLGAVTGIFDKANIEASSYVSNVSGVTVDSTATAIGNLAQVNLYSTVDGVAEHAGLKCTSSNDCVPHDVRDPLSNHVVIADLTQFAYADITATSSVHGVHLDNQITDTTAVVNSVATAIGNAVIINVGNAAPTTP